MGPLHGMKIIEMGALGPVPWCAMMLSDMGAEVIRVDRAGDVESAGQEPVDFANRRGRRSIALDLTHHDGVEVLLRLVGEADALIEGARPGVAERLGIGPDVCLQRNPRLVYGRMTGWGQTGPMAQVPGHDLNYLALTGLLHTIGPADGRPAAPLNLIADYGGGGMLLAFGILCGLLETSKSGRGQVVDAAMIDGSALLGALVYGWSQRGTWRDEREANIVDGGSPSYGTYETADGRWVAISANEPKFYHTLVDALGLDVDSLPPLADRSTWKSTRERFAEVFRTRTRDEWVSRLQGHETCFAPVLTLAEALSHQHNVERQMFVEVDGTLQPAPAPRFSRTPGVVASGAAQPGEHSIAILRECGFDAADIARLTTEHVVRTPESPATCDTAVPPPAVIVESGDAERVV